MGHGREDSPGHVDTSVEQQRILGVLGVLFK